MAVGHSAVDTVIPETLMDLENKTYYPAVTAAKDSCIVVVVAVAVAVGEERRT
jgi:hypothetical protein